MAAVTRSTTLSPADRPCTQSLQATVEAAAAALLLHTQLVPAAAAPQEASPWPTMKQHQQASSSSSSKLVLAVLAIVAAAMAAMLPVCWVPRVYPPAVLGVYSLMFSWVRQGGGYP